MAQIEGFTPLSRYERQRLLNESVKAPNDFTCSDEEFFAGNGRLVRLRPPRPGEAEGKVRSLLMIGLHPMVLIMRKTMELPTRPVALIAFGSEAFSTLPVDLLRMGDEALLEMLTGSSKIMFKAELRWWPWDE